MAEMESGAAQERRPAGGPAAGRAPSDHVRSLMRGLRILEYVHARREPVAVRQVAEAVGLNLSTTYHLVNTLIWEGYLRRGRDRRLLPGRLPSQAVPRPEDAPAVRRALGRTAYAVDDVAVLARFDAGEAYISAAVEVPGAANAGRYPPGARDVAHVLAAGRVLLAARTGDELPAAIEQTRSLARTRRETFNESWLLEDLEQVREQRFATLVDDGHVCVSAPVGDTRTALAVVLAPQRFRRNRDRLIAVVQKAAGTIADALAETAEAPRHGVGAQTTFIHREET